MKTPSSPEIIHPRQWKDAIFRVAKLTSISLSLNLSILVPACQKKNTAVSRSKNIHEALYPLTITRPWRDKNDHKPLQNFCTPWPTNNPWNVLEKNKKWRKYKLQNESKISIRHWWHFLRKSRDKRRLTWEVTSSESPTVRLSLGTISGDVASAPAGVARLLIRGFLLAVTREMANLAAVIAHWAYCSPTTITSTKSRQRFI